MEMQHCCYKDMNINYIPNLTHPSGQVLTTADWALAGVSIACCDLKVLLIKPGIVVLKQLKHLKQYWAWTGQLILNTNDLLIQTSDRLELRSPFDGRTFVFKKQEIEALIEQLQPDVLMSSTLPYKENNIPSMDALNGVIYCGQNQLLHIQDAQYRFDFRVLDENCKCNACIENLTRAYFNHLYQHTPLLCHRWLIIHNQWMVHVPILAYHLRVLY